jgi:UDP-N-acetylmuramyl tripeptide synthase
MARAAEAGADVVVVTSDNPRSESPAAILRDIVAGLSRPAHAVTEDRAAAIADAVLSADAADVVLLAGKGHETYQEIAGRRLPFDDVEQARVALARRAEAVK